jgi:hypothetical protein
VIAIVMGGGLGSTQKSDDLQDHRFSGIFLEFFWNLFVAGVAITPI